MSEFEYFKMILSQSIKALYAKAEKLADRDESTGLRKMAIFQADIEKLAKDGEITTRTKNRLLDVLDGIYTLELIIRNNNK